MRQDSDQVGSVDDPRDAVPGAREKLERAVEAVACVLRVVAAGLTVTEPGPDVIGDGPRDNGCSESRRGGTRRGGTRPRGWWPSVWSKGWSKGWSAGLSDYRLNGNRYLGVRPRIRRSRARNQTPHRLDHHIQASKDRLAQIINLWPDPALRGSERHHNGLWGDNP